MVIRPGRPVLARADPCVVLPLPCVDPCASCLRQMIRPPPFPPPRTPPAVPARRQVTEIGLVEVSADGGVAISPESSPLPPDHTPLVSYRGTVTCQTQSGDIACFTATPFEHANAGSRSLEDVRRRCDQTFASQTASVTIRKHGHESPWSSRFSSNGCRALDVTSLDPMGAFARPEANQVI